MVVYVHRFEVLAGRDRDFKEAWAEVTRSYLAHAGSLGSRLHQDERGSIGLMRSGRRPMREIPRT